MLSGKQISKSEHNDILLEKQEIQEFSNNNMKIIALFII